MFTLGVVPYLNALPLYRTLEQSGRARILRAVPALLTSRLQAGECDAAIIPAVDFLRGAGERILSTACIGGHGPVRSVLLFTRVPLAEIHSIAVDTSSHTSVALLRVLLADGHGITPPFVEHPPDLNAMLGAHDACLLIGDAALEAAIEARQRNIEILDLGEEWTRQTDKPFVFAAWVSRRGLDEGVASELETLLDAARDEGTHDLNAIVRENPIQTRLSADEVEDYLRHALQFHLTPEHRAGLDEFRRRCVRVGMVQT